MCGAVFVPWDMRTLLLSLMWPAGLLLAQDAPLSAVKPVPAMQVLPLPHSMSSFQLDGKELTTSHYDPADMRPFWYPILTSQGISLVRMGHPHDPVTHSHHNGVWISHNNVNGLDFWGDHAKEQGRIITQRVDRYEDADDSAIMLMTNHWVRAADNAVQVIETRRTEVRPLDGSRSWLMLIDLEFVAPKDQKAVFGPTFFGLIGVRMAKSIGVHDGGGRILNSEGQVNEAEVFRKPARWCDYAGRISNDELGFAGITLMDHPSNPQSGKAFHVRNDGWMCACTSPEAAIEVTDTQPLRLRYGLWVHDGLAPREQCESHWKAFQALPLAELDTKKK